jgi:hypothetical protein
MILQKEVFVQGQSSMSSMPLITGYAFNFSYLFYAEPFERPICQGQATLLYIRQIPSVI